MAVLGIAHFLVDFSCALLVGNLASSHMVLLLILYNFCAFALQMPFGIYIEGRFSPRKVASLGMVLVALSWGLIFLPALSLIVAGVGNALFHLGGGLFVMNKTSKASPLGVFVAPGALGIYLGAAVKTGLQIPLLIVLALFAFLILRLQEKPLAHPPKEMYIEGKQLAIIALFLVVVMRGFLGVVQIFPWKSEWSLAFVLAVVLGKMVGGYLADSFGPYPVGVMSLVVAATAFLWPHNAVIGLIGIFAFQMTMPITLWAISRLTAKGFGFGLLTFGLFVGSIPTFLRLQVSFPLPILVALSTMIFIFAMKKGAPQ